MSFLGFLTKKKFYLHLGISIVITVILFLGILQFLKYYTNHAETYVVPDFYGRTIEELEAVNYNKIYEFVVIDSIYDPNNKKEAIVIQNPYPGARVKKGRKVYVTTVAKSSEKVDMPDLIDLSLRQAINLLNAKGLRVNRLEYVKDFADNAVLEQTYDGELIEPGTEIDKGSSIDLILGLGKNSKVPVPFVIGKTASEAVNTINSASFNLGNVYYLDGKDPVHSRVYQQDPDWGENASLYKGQEINIWMRSDQNFDFDKLIRSYEPDTIHADTTSAPETFDEF